MSTVVDTAPAPAGADAPIDLVKALYGLPSGQSADPTGEAQSASTPHAEPGPATPPQETVAPAAEAKPDPSREAEGKAKDEENHRSAARRLGKQVHELEAQMGKLAEQNRILQARLDGTYEEPISPTPEQVQARAVFAGRELASRELAVQRYGEERVKERIYDPNSELSQLLQRQKWHEQRIAESLQPTLEAWTILEEEVIRGKYGNDPSQWAAKIIAEAKPALQEEWKKTLSAPVVGTPAPTVTQARGDGGPPTRVKSMTELFYGNPATPA